MSHANGLRENAKNAHQPLPPNPQRPTAVSLLVVWVSSTFNSSFWEITRTELDSAFSKVSVHKYNCIFFLGGEGVGLSSRRLDSCYP